MSPSPHVAVTIDLRRVRRNAVDIRRRTGVPLIAVVKADAYGLGAARVAAAIADIADGFFVFTLSEVIDAGLAGFGKPTIVVQAASRDPEDYRSIGAHPAVWSADTADALRRAAPVLSVDTGQQRFGTPIDDIATIDAILRAGDIRQAYTHATKPEQAAAFVHALRGRVPTIHAAGTALLDDPASRLDAVRPGLALYQGSVTTTSRLVEVTDTRGPAGYSGFSARRHGVILAGYSHGLRAGPCRVNGRESRILEVGMQSAFVECAAGDRVGDEVELLGANIAENEIAAAWGTGPQEVLVRMTGMGVRTWRE